MATVTDPDGRETRFAGAVRVVDKDNEGEGRSPVWFDNNPQTIDMADAAVTLNMTDGATNQIRSNVLYVDPNSSGVSENLLLPPEADIKGLRLWIINTGGEGIAAQNDAGGAIMTIPTGEMGAVVCDGTTIRGFIGFDSITATGAEINKLDGIAATAYPVVTELISFTESASTTYTGTVTIPTGAILQDIGFVSTVLWGGTSASLIIGDADDPNGWLQATDLKATDLLVGEVFQMRGGIASAGFLGAIGDYTVAATSRIGRVTAGVDSGVYYGAASEVIFVIAAGTPSTTGRSFGWVTYVVPTVVASTDT